MKRALILISLIASLAAVACGSGDKSPAPTRTPDRDAQAAPTAQPTGADSTTSDSSGDGPFGDLLGLMFNSSIGEATGGDNAPALGDAGDLGKYLLKEGDLPDGYAPMGDVSFTVPDDAGEFAGATMAVSTFERGDLESDTPKDSALVMSMVLQPPDADALAKAFDKASDGLSDEEMREVINSANGGGALGIEFRDVGTLDTGGLGDRAVGFGMTMDMSGFFEAIGESFGGTMSDDDRDALAAFGAITMRMYMFERNGLGGAVMRVAFGGGDTASADADRDLARTMYERMD